MGFKTHLIHHTVFYADNSSLGPRGKIIEE